MAKDEILTATPEWLNEQALKCLGIELVETESEENRIRLGDAMLTKKRLAYKNIDDELCLTDRGRWNPVKDIRDAADLQTKIKEMGLIDKYSKHLVSLIDSNCDLIDNKIFASMDATTLIFKIVNATPEQRTKSFLLAMMEAE